MTKPSRLAVALLASLLLPAFLLAGCGRDAAPHAPDIADSPGTAALAAPALRPAPAPAAASGPLVVFLGDSLTAGLGLDQDQAYPALLGERLVRAGDRVRVLNAGVSGDTTAGGLRRLDWLLRQRPAVMVVCLGAN